MQKAKPLPLETVMGNSHKSHWLEKTERAAVISSWLGLGAAVLSKELLALGLPLTLTASLNWANRKRWQQQFEQQQRGEIAQIHDTLATFPDPLDFNAMSQKLAGLEQSNQTMTGQIEALKQQVRVKFKPEQLERLEDSMAQLRADLGDWQKQAVRKQDLTAHLNKELHQLYDRLDRLSEPSEEAWQVETEIDRLRGQLQVLAQQITPLEVAKWQHLNERVARIQSQISQLDKGLVPVRRKQQAMVRRLLPRMIQMIRENHAASGTTSLQRTVTHRPTQSSIRPSSRHTRSQQILHQSQREK
ncbi:hypothetical protein IQ235_00520 [Oscillatoriales cyanobacterium LEGE 11467]|uniref:Uncharacterized protein n=1 Tax=Zarconia navalis LEGE 11467 TaxID=1828826 RepID=A0A928Z7D5_9CYAN|nr:hypothetical protein [Zarconia navalis]MBE9039279.1 hypothetical protein [Zarconia navalis LEGE 11467]